MDEVYITISLIFLRSVHFLLRCKTVYFNVVTKKIYILTKWVEGKDAH